MAKVRCPCGREYNFPDEHLGKRVTCAKCGNSFVARAAADGAIKPDAPTQTYQQAASPKAAPKPPPPAKPAAPAATKPAAPAKGRIGDRAVAAHLVTREQLDACLHYQQALRKIPGEAERRLGEILVEKNLLSKVQLQRLLASQDSGKAGAISAATNLPPKRSTRDHPLTEQSREAIRLSVESAARQAEQQEAAVREAREKGPSRLAWVRPVHVLAPLGAIVAIVVLIKLWPAPTAERTLVAYLTSCDEANVQPDASLATRSLGIAVRDFRDVELQSATTYDFAAVLKAVHKPEGKLTWQEVLERPEPSPEERRALRLLLPVIPANLDPNSLSDFQITVQPATVQLVFKRRGTNWFDQGSIRFLLVRAASPGWQCDWKVADFERAEPPPPSPPAEAPKKR